MPWRLAARLTALRSSPGSRMLMRASLGANSNRVGLRLERSNCVRSLSATNASACWLVFSRGSLARVLGLRFIMLDFFRMHEPCTDGSDESVTGFGAVGECD